MDLGKAMVTHTK